MHTCPRLGMVPAPALAILPCGFISFQPWEEQGERQASPGGCSPQVRRTPWAALNTHPPVGHSQHHKPFSSSSASSPGVALEFSNESTQKRVRLE